ncbi:S1C family serine protease [Antrihabitans cavernicola]|uniref:PDZ domain-containing protein n=1 Tax=Antrihabitans cavernicola TaxID=2495913 RepID=A0A5A7SGL0_9NOCA|nr:trypsin-like peptidase domain-containing protein [Spelaeibacter cavernicola]KAA0023783.1 PDZ domain-containing protein [Spelaeibacter cavernicola]
MTDDRTGDNVPQDNTTPQQTGNQPPTPPQQGQGAYPPHQGGQQPPAGYQGNTQQFGAYQQPSGYPTAQFGQAAQFGQNTEQGAYRSPYQPTEHLAAPQQHPVHEQPKPKRGRTGLVAGAVALALVSGGVGGAVGAMSTHSDSNGSSGSVNNALNQPIPNANPAINAPAGSVQAVAGKVLPSVVMIKVVGSREEGEGSGVVLSSDGLILTNNHVATGAGPNGKLTVAFADGSTANASVVGADPVSDIAVIKADGKSGLTPIELGSSNGVQVGQQVVAVGSPLGLAGTVTSGIVSSLNRPVSTSGDSGNQNTVIDAIQTDAAINPGNSGGALVDMNGKLIGINTAIASLGGQQSAGQQGGSIGLGFAIPVDQARRVADELTKTGKATHALIGIQVPSQDDANGATVSDVTAGSPAEKAGIPKGAVITKVDDRIIDTGDALIAAVRSHAPGDKVQVTYTDAQGKNPKTTEVTLTDAPATTDTQPGADQNGADPNGGGSNGGGLPGGLLPPLNGGR